MTTPFHHAPEPRPDPTDSGCQHLDTIEVSDSDASECPSCIAEGTTWVHLRMCLQCGEVGCCDFSPKRHARAHHSSTAHPLIRSIEPGELWVWCFPDARIVAEMPGA